MVKMGKVQLVCPKCRHEFSYNNGYYDVNIARLKKEINEILEQLADYKTKDIKYKKRK